MPLDTIQIKATGDIFREFNELFWHETKTGYRELPNLDIFSDGRPIEKNRYLHLDARKWNKEHSCTGARIMYWPELNKTVLNFSAKVLGSSYMDGLSEDTIELAIENINKVLGSSCNLDVYSLVENSSIETIDNTINIPIDAEKIVPLIDALKALVNWKCKKLDTRFLYTASFMNKSEQLVFYSKLHELMEQSKELLALLKLDKNFIRVEHRFKRGDAYKKYNSGLVSVPKNFYDENMQLVKSTDAISSIPFHHALKNKNSSRLLKERISTLDIRNDKDELFSSNEIYNLMQEISQREIVSLFGHYGVFERLNYSMNALELALKEKHKNNSRQAFHKELNKYREEIARAEKYDADKLKMDADTCFEIVNSFKKDIFSELERLAS